MSSSPSATTNLPNFFRIWVNAASPFGELCCMCGPVRERRRACRLARTCPMVTGSLQHCDRIHCANARAQFPSCAVQLPLSPGAECWMLEKCNHRASLRRCHGRPSSIVYCVSINFGRDFGAFLQQPCRLRIVMIVRFRTIFLPCSVSIS